MSVVGVGPALATSRTALAVSTRQSREMRVQRERPPSSKVSPKRRAK